MNASSCHRQHSENGAENPDAFDFAERGMVPGSYQPDVSGLLADESFGFFSYSSSETACLVPQVGVDIPRSGEAVQ
ncbi:MAG TPA: hypothetical protein PLY87_20380, partial [Planctomycetaceae bacterium]|nr:hypothetical protein [Planctomycetaceae bacterium]HQZ67463.1 hypothetical protein [Planctomycetaceae bacterium]